MPDLRKSEGDSTDSLIEESESVVRNTIHGLIPGCSADIKECKNHRRYSEPYHNNLGKKTILLFIIKYKLIFCRK